MVHTLVFFLFVTLVFAARPFLIRSSTEAFVSVDPATEVECGSDRILVKNTTCLGVPQLIQLSVINPLPPGYRLLNLSATITAAVNGNASVETKLIDISGKVIQELVISDNGKQPFQCQSFGHMALPSNYSDSWTSNWVYYKNSANTLTLYINTTESNNKIHFKSSELCVSKLFLLLYGSDVDPKVTKIEPVQIPVGQKSSYITVYANNLIVGSDYFCSFYLTATRSIETVTITVSQPTNQVRCDIPDHVTDNVGYVTFRLFPDLRYGIFSADAIKMTIFPLPLVTKIEPSSGPTGGGNNVTLVGENFFENATLTVSFGEISVIAMYVNSNTITCTPPKYSHLSGGVVIGKDVSVPISISEDGIHTSTTNVNYLYLDVPPDLWPTPKPGPGPEPYNFLEFLRENLWVVIVSGALVLVGIFVITSFVVKNCRKNSETFNYKLLQTELPNIDLPKCIIDPKELKLKERIGSGRYADVYRATWRKTDVAVKKLPENRDMYLIKQLFKEINVMINLRHPNVITFMGATVNPASNMSIVTEYLSRGSLFSIVHDPNILLECEHIRKMSADCARGMNYLHKSRIIHRDLKTTNLLVDENWNIKVADFGLSKIIDGKQSSSSFSSVGSPAYSSPEVLKSQSYSFKSDVYSFAIVLLEFCTRTVPFKGMAPYNIVLEVATKDFRPEIPEEAEVPEDFSQMIRDCWETDPDKRPTFEELLDTLEGFAFESQYVFPVELSEKYRFTRDTVDSSLSSSTYTNKNTTKLISLLKGSASSDESSDGDSGQTNSYRENAETVGSEFSSFYYEESNPSYNLQNTSFPPRIQNKKKYSSTDLLSDS